MYIRRKVFSILEDWETGEERYFSTTDITLEDEEEKLFSVIDNEEQREFARRDYEGLTEAQQRVLKIKRDELAKKYLRRRHLDEDELEMIEHIKKDHPNYVKRMKERGRTPRSLEKRVKGAISKIAEGNLEWLKGDKIRTREAVERGK